jgi:hypothetical protein
MTEHRRAALDHLVLAGPDLMAAVAWFAELTGVDPVPGGSHPGLGTANYLVALGDRTPRAYLEIIGPDPEQPAPEQGRPFGIDELAAPRLVTWAVAVDDIDGAVARARDAGYDPGAVRSMSRRTAAGELLSWRLTASSLDGGDGLVPFLIHWGTTPHPTTRDLPSIELIEFGARHPEPDTVRPALRALGADLAVELGELAALTAVVAGVDGAVSI